jgi:hypothetical protein
VSTRTYTALIDVVPTDAAAREWAFGFYKAEKGLGRHHDLTGQERTEALESFATGDP